MQKNFDGYKAAENTAWNRLKNQSNLDCYYINNLSLSCVTIITIIFIIIIIIIIII